MQTDLASPDLADGDAPAPRTAAELPPQDLLRLRALADSLDCLLTDDLCSLGKVKQSTADAWAKRGEGPDYVMFGNRRLYPREALRKFLEKHQRARAANSRSML